MTATATESRTDRPQVHLNQLLAIAKGTKSQAGRRITDIYHTIQRAEPWSGISRTYRKRFDDGVEYPGEIKFVQVRASDVIRDMMEDITRMIDVQASLDRTNQNARADVVVHGQVLFRQAPATTLLFLEKELTDLFTVFSKMPVLDIADKWQWDGNARAWASMPLETTKTRKVRRNHLLAPATEKHPAQVESYTEDEVEGFWTTVKFSGAMQGEDRRAILDRIRILQDAVKQARERANETPVQDMRLGEHIMRFIVSPMMNQDDAEM